MREYKIGDSLNEKEFAQFSYIKCKELCGSDNETITEYLNGITKVQVEHLRDMEGLTEFEIKLIEERLK